MVEIRSCIFADGGRTFKALLTLLVALMSGSWAAGEQWPRVKPIKQSFEVNLAAGLVAIDLPITSNGGAVLYRLSCRGGADNVLDELSERDGVNWVGHLCAYSIKGMFQFRKILCLPKMSHDLGIPGVSFGEAISLEPVGFTRSLGLTGAFACAVSFSALAFGT